MIIDIVERKQLFNIVGLIDSYKPKKTKIFNYAVLGREDNLATLMKQHNFKSGIIAIGDNWARGVMHNKIVRLIPEFEFVNAIHPNAIIGKNVMIGEGTVIMEGVIVNSSSCIGKHVILNTKSNVDYDCEIDDFSSIAPGATIGRNVKIGRGSAISLDANIIENTCIGENSMVGAGSLELKSFGDHKVVYGTPVKTIRERKSSDKYSGLIEDTPDDDHGYTLKCIEINTDEDVNNYHTILDKFKAFNTFYSLEYCNHNILKKLHYFIFSKNGEPCVIMPLFLYNVNLDKKDETHTFYNAVSPYGYSGPLINEIIGFSKLELFWQAVDHWYQSNNVVTEFVRFNLNNNQKGYTGHLLSTLNNVKGKLTTFNDIWDSFKPKVRNNYRKAENNNLKAEIESSSIGQETIDSFYAIYIATMKRNKATQNYFYPKSYFENLIYNEQNKIVIALIYFEDKPISTELLIVNGDAMYSYLGGTISDYFHLRPNDFLKIEMIKWGLQNNMKYYALGGGRKDGDSLYKYKKAFFPKDDDVMFYTGRKVIDNVQYKKFMQKVTDDEVFIENSITDTKVYFPYYLKDAFESKI
jgi:sugar O-acyltransferase (sialic acid O-acetyltransferase NeuD family)